MELERMTLTSASGSKLNLDALYQIMPSCFTEVRDDKTGKISHKINFTTLRELLGDNAYEGADEEYGFSWVGKNAARREAASSINKTLRPCPEESVDWDNTENLYIEGDNLEVLKLLQKSYLGKVKMIYIDPPYNTGNDFVYRDDFAMSADDYDQQAGNVDELGNRFRKNADSNARFHSDWCSMIYERLLVARALLSEDGVIFISIDDCEIVNAIKLCSELFGQDNFVSQFIWKKKQGGGNDSSYVVAEHEYIVCFAKNKSSLSFNLDTKYKLDDALYPYSDAIGDYGLITLDKASIQFSQSLVYEIVGPNGEIYTPRIVKGKQSCWRWSKAKVEAQYSDLVFKNGKVYTKYYRPKGVTPRSLLIDAVYGRTESGNDDISSLFEKNPFSYPKPVALIHHFCSIASASNSLILDFFSGSATTAHAVMQLNAEDGGSRKFIMVQLPEVTDEKSEARKAGYNTICEIGKERIRRAGKKIKEESGEKAANLDTGFRVFKCEDSFMNDVYFAPSELKQEDLFSQIENIKDGTSDLSLLFGCMLDWGVQLSLPLSHFTVAGKTIHNVNDGDLVACFAEDINEDVISAIAELSPLRVVFRDSCFSESAFKMNLFELFKQKCGWSEEQVRDKVRVI